MTSEAQGSESIWQTTMQLPVSKVMTGLRYFIVLTVFGFAIIFYTTSTTETFTALKQLDMRFLFLAALLQMADILSDPRVREDPTLSQDWP